MSARERFRNRLLGFLICLFALTIVARLYYVQIVMGAEYEKRADRQYAAPDGSIYERGAIYFTTKDGETVSAATVKSGFFLYVNPKLITDSEGVYNKLSAIIPIPRDEFMAKAGRRDDGYEEIVHRLESDTAGKIEKLKIPGVNLAREEWRYYPGESLAAHVLGLVGYQGDTLAGRYGLERYYDETLSRDGASVYRNFFAEIFSGVGKAIKKDSEFQGDLTLTIEPTVETYLEGKLKAIGEKWESEETGGIVMDPRTGEIVAMAAFPTFNPNNFQTAETARVFTNPLVENVYEMGSIIKPLTLAAGLDAKVITPETTYDDQGFLFLNGSRVSNFDGKGRGRVSMQEVLNQSLNTGAAFVAERIGRERFVNYFSDFGLGEETGIDLPNEARGLIENLEQGKELELATASFGQGIAASPIETVRALAALANGGVLPNPHVVRSVNYTMGVNRKKVYNEGLRVIRTPAADTITEMLVTVVDKALLGGSIKQKNYAIAAKTGTAQIAKPGGGGYFDDRYLHSFFGYFPATDPKFIVFYYTLNPKGVKYASETLTRPFADTAKFLINYYNLPPDR